MSWALLIFIIVDAIILWYWECKDLVDGILVNILVFTLVGGPLSLAYIDIARHDGVITILIVKVVLAGLLISKGTVLLTWLEKRGGK